MAENLLRRIFWLLNHFFTIPVLRMGLGALIGTPPGGYIMLIRTVGRRSGRVRYAPVNYAIIDGCVYCIAGFGHISDWFLNLQSAPRLGADHAGWRACRPYGDGHRPY